MKSEAAIRVVADVSRNRLTLSFAGEIKAADMERYESEIARALHSIRPGFSLLTDMTRLASMELGCVASLERTMKGMRTAGVGLVVRVIPDATKDIGLNILSLFHYPRSLRIITAVTLEEAESVLNESD